MTRPRLRELRRPSLAALLLSLHCAAGEEVTAAQARDAGATTGPEPDAALVDGRGSGAGGAGQGGGSGGSAGRDAGGGGGAAGSGGTEGGSGGGAGSDGAAGSAGGGGSGGAGGSDGGGGPNLCVNPGFEAGELTPWTSSDSVPSVVQSNARSGTWAALIPGGHDLDQTMAAAPSTSYTFSVWGKSTGGQWNGMLVAWLDNNGVVIGDTNYLPPYTGAYEARSVTITTPLDARYMKVSFKNNAGSDLYVDDCMVTRN